MCFLGESLSTMGMNRFDWFLFLESEMDWMLPAGSSVRATRNSSRSSVGSATGIGESCATRGQAKRDPRRVERTRTRRRSDCSASLAFRLGRR